MKLYTVQAGFGVLVIFDPDYQTKTFITHEGNSYVYYVEDSEGRNLQTGRHENLSDVEQFVDLDHNDIQMIENVFGTGDDL